MADEQKPVKVKPDGNDPAPPVDPAPDVEEAEDPDQVTVGL